MNRLLHAFSQSLPSALRTPVSCFTVSVCLLAAAAWLWIVSRGALESAALAATVALGIVTLQRAQVLLECQGFNGSSTPAKPWRSNRIRFCAATVLLFVSATTLKNLPAPGLNTRLIAENGQPLLERITQPGIDPSTWLDSGVFESPRHLEQSGWITVPEAGATQLQLYASHGEVQLSLDSDEPVSIHDGSNVRIRYLSLRDRPGRHRLHLQARFEGPIPAVGLRLASPVTARVADWRFHFSPTLTDAAGRLLVLRKFLWLAVVFALLIALQALPASRRLPTPAAIGQSVPSTGLMLALTLVVAAGFRAWIIHRSGGVLDADEAAFGIMAQRVLEGEFPPLFHYGQDYQGTLEAGTLASLFHLFGASAHVLKWHAAIGYLFGMALILRFAMRRVPRGACLFLGLYLAITPQHLSWLSTKAWFGYNSTWALGACALLLALQIAGRPATRPWRWGVLGLLMGVGLYTLPLVAPFLVTVVIILLRTNINELRTCRGPLLLLGIAIGLLPMILYDVSTGGLASRFLLHGRPPSAPGAPFESTTWGQFIYESVPVLLGVRPVHSPYFRHLPQAMTAFLSVLFWIGAWRITPKLYTGIRRFLDCGAIDATFLLGLLFITCVMTVLFTQFGVWPWYCMALYPFLALILYEGVAWIGSRIPVAAWLSCLIVFAVHSVGSLTTAPFMHHPTSLLQQGLLLENDHRELLRVLADRNIQAVVCDQGMDIAPYGGRDWLGERITFESQGEVGHIDNLSRRHKHLAKRLHRAPRIAYLTHRNFLWWDGNVTRYEDRDRVLTSFSRIAALFGEHVLDYRRYDIGMYTLFEPRPGAGAEAKSLYTVTASSNLRTERLLDGEIGPRFSSMGSWATKGPAQPGDFVELDLGGIRNVEKLVLYHGADRRGASPGPRFDVSLDGERWESVGRFSLHALANASVWRSLDVHPARKLRVVLDEEQRGNAWTISEVWVTSHVPSPSLESSSS